MKKLKLPRLKFLFAETCQNRFVLVDALSEKRIDEAALAKAHAILMQEERDDVLVLYQGRGPYFKMLVYGADKQFGEFCGNGALGVAEYLFSEHPLQSVFYLETPYGIIELYPGTIKLPPVRFELNPRFVNKPELFGLHYVEMMEPHLVMEGSLSDEELVKLGQMLNARRDIFPQGINVNVFTVLGENRLFVKTYERGVQRMTLACGSGSIACSAFYGKEGVFHITTPGGELEIVLGQDSVMLKGSASFCDIERTKIGG